MTSGIIPKLSSSHYFTHVSHHTKLENEINSDRCATKLHLNAVQYVPNLRREARKIFPNAFIRHEPTFDHPKPIILGWIAASIVMHKSISIVLCFVTFAIKRRRTDLQDPQQAFAWIENALVDVRAFICAYTVFFSTEGGAGAASAFSSQSLR